MKKSLLLKMVYVENPWTGYAIKKGGPTYEALRMEGIDVEMLPRVRRGSRSPRTPHRTGGCGCGSKSPQRPRVLRSTDRRDRVDRLDRRGRMDRVDRRRAPLRRSYPLRRSPRSSLRSLSPRGGGRRAGRRTARRTSARYPLRNSHSPQKPGYTKRGKKIGRLPAKTKVMRLPVAKPRPLEETLKDIPKSRLEKRERVRRQIKRSKEGRGSRTRGWGAAAPQRGRERHALMEECGEGCFLQPDTEGFPICAALREDQGCAIDCRGVDAALVRSRQWGYDNVAKMARELQEKKCGR